MENQNQYHISNAPQDFLEVIGNAFGNWQTVDLGIFFEDIKRQKNLKEWAGKNLANSLKYLTNNGAKLFIYSCSGDENQNQLPFALEPPFVPESAQKIILAPFCQAGRNRSQVLRIILEELFGDDPRIEIRNPHGVTLGLDPHFMRDKSYSCLESDKTKFFAFQQQIIKKMDVGNMLSSHPNKLSYDNVGFAQRFGKLKAPRIYEDVALESENWEEIAGWNGEPDTKNLPFDAKARRKEIYDYFSKNYYNLKRKNEDKTQFVFIGFSDALHRLVSRIMETNGQSEEKENEKEKFANLTLVVIDLKDLIQNPPQNSDFIKHSKESYDNYHEILKNLVFLINKKKS